MLILILLLECYPFIWTRCTQCTIMWNSLSVTFDRSVIFSWYSVSVTNKTDCHDITEILLKVVLNTININHHLDWAKTFPILKTKNTLFNPKWKFINNFMLNCDDIMMLKIITVYFCLHYTMMNTEIQSAATRHVAIPGHLIFTTYPTHSIAITL